MKSQLIVVLLVLAVASTFARILHKSPYQKTASANFKRNSGLDNLFHKISLAVGKRNPDDEDWINNGNSPGKRCLNTFDDGCINGNLPLANSDDEWLNGGGTPGKRCLNTFDDSCANGGLPDGNSDDDWINHGGSPGKRCLFNTFDEGCSNGGLPSEASDDEWNRYGPGK